MFTLHSADCRHFIQESQRGQGTNKVQQTLAASDLKSGIFDTLHLCLQPPVATIA